MHSIIRMIRDAFLSSERIEPTGEQTPRPARSVATDDQALGLPEARAPGNTW